MLIADTDSLLGSERINTVTEGVEMKKSLMLAAFTLAFSFNIHAADSLSPEKKKLIDTLLEQTGQSAIAMGKQFSNVFIQQMTMVLKQTQPNIDPKAFAILEEEITAVVNEEMSAGDSFRNMLYPIYNKHFSNAELEKMIELNNTELGKKLIRVMPVITQEGMQAGQQFGRTLGPKIQQRIVTRFKAEGIQ